MVKSLEIIQNRRKIASYVRSYIILPVYSIEHCYYMNSINIGIDDVEAVSLTMEQFPSLKENSLIQPDHDIDHASALKEFTQYITYNMHRSTDESRKNNHHLNSLKYKENRLR